MLEAPPLPAAPHPAQQEDQSIPARRLTSAIGALVEAEDLPAGPDRAARLRELVVEHHVVFVPGFGTDEASFTELAQSLGTPSTHPLQRFTGREGRRSLRSSMPPIVRRRDSRGTPI